MKSTTKLLMLLILVMGLAFAGGASTPFDAPQPAHGVAQVASFDDCWPFVCDPPPDPDCQAEPWRCQIDGQPAEPVSVIAPSPFSYRGVTATRWFMVNKK